MLQPASQPVCRRPPPRRPLPGHNQPDAAASCPHPARRRAAPHSRLLPAHNKRGLLTRGRPSAASSRPSHGVAAPCPPRAAVLARDSRASPSSGGRKDGAARDLALPAAPPHARPSSFHPALLAASTHADTRPHPMPRRSPCCILYSLLLKRLG